MPALIRVSDALDVATGPERAALGKAPPGPIRMLSKKRGGGGGGSRCIISLVVDFFSSSLSSNPAMLEPRAAFADPREAQGEILEASLAIQEL